MRSWCTCLFLAKKLSGTLQSIYHRQRRECPWPVLDTENRWLNRFRVPSNDLTTKTRLKCLNLKKKIETSRNYEVCNLIKLG